MKKRGKELKTDEQEKKRPPLARAPLYIIWYFAFIASTLCCNSLKTRGKVCGGKWQCPFHNVDAVLRGRKGLRNSFVHNTGSSGGRWKRGNGELPHFIFLKNRVLSMGVEAVEAKNKVLIGVCVK